MAKKLKIIYLTWYPTYFGKIKLKGENILQNTSIRASLWYTQPHRANTHVKNTAAQ